MPQESNNRIFNTPCKNSRGLKGLIYNANDASYSDEIIDDRELAHRKAEEAGNITICLMVSNIIQSFEVIIKFSIAKITIT